MLRFYWLNSVNLIEAGGPYGSASEALDAAAKVYANLGWSREQTRDRIEILKTVDETDINKPEVALPGT